MRTLFNRSALIAALTLAAGPAFAQQDPEPSKELAAAYRTLSFEARRLEAAVRYGDPSPRLGVELTAFAGRAAELAAKIEAEDGPADLGCIYRGIAEDVALRGQAMSRKDAVLAHDERVELAAVLDDASEVLPAVYRNPNPYRVAGAPAPSCQASGEEITPESMGLVLTAAE